VEHALDKAIEKRCEKPKKGDRHRKVCPKPEKSLQFLLLLSETGEKFAGGVAFRRRKKIKKIEKRA
jgi:hypothetical protein